LGDLGVDELILEYIRFMSYPMATAGSFPQG